ncbi:MAG: Fe-S cluster assembly protein SufD [Chloroflexota bacterium]|nr:Fe-S cluster assembly protein SufD [Dehalococcoidia bacterium]MDW8254631.1 Fe-S cluster assembly protein SufD [Chloroflexota bacterium]
MSGARGPAPGLPLTGTGRLAGGFSRAGVDELSQRKGEPEWLRQRRLAAWEVFSATPWPTGKEEAWRRIDIHSVTLDGIVPVVGPDDGAVPPPLEEGDASEAGMIALHNGAAVASRAALPPGVIFTSLDAAVRDYPDLVEPFLGTIVRPEDGIFAALNTAFWSGGVFLYVPAGVEVALPLRALHWADGAGVGVGGRSLVVVDAGGAATFIDDCLSAPGAAGLVTDVVELRVGAGARLRYIALHDRGRGVASFSWLRGITARDATLHWLLVVLGSRLARVDLAAVMDEPGSTHELLGLCFGDDAQQFDLHTLQLHAAPHATSDLLFKSVLKESARSAFAGLIQVAKGAQRTDAYLANRNLLLSDKARADSIPTLEIEANDVRCTHGATVGPIDEEQVFYLMTRGIPRIEAERMIVEGFLEPLLSRVPIERVRARLDQSIARKMEGR